MITGWGESDKVILQVSIAVFSRAIEKFFRAAPYKNWPVRLSNRAQCRLTTLIEAIALTTTLRCHPATVYHCSIVAIGLVCYVFFDPHSASAHVSGSADQMKNHPLSPQSTVRRCHGQADYARLTYDWRNERTQSLCIIHWRHRCSTITTHFTAY